MNMRSRIETLADSALSDKEGSPRTLQSSSLLLTEEVAHVDQDEDQPRTRKRKAQDHLEQEVPRREHTAIRLHDDIRSPADSSSASSDGIRLDTTQSQYYSAC